MHSFLAMQTLEEIRVKEGETIPINASHNTSQVCQENGFLQPKLAPFS
jgi:hypothetical protein